MSTDKTEGPQYTKRTKETKYIVIHCSDTRPSQDVGADTIRKWHTEERGWLDIGYHLVIRRDGSVEQGRPLNMIGAHVEGHNSESVSICLVGGLAENGKRREFNFTAKQMHRLAFEVDRLLSSYPQALVWGHCDFPGVTKTCPNFNVRAWWYGGA